jgi:hypothetical protein
MRTTVLIPTAATLAALAVPAVAGAAVPGDDAAGALSFEPVTAENGPVAARQRVLRLDGAGPDAAPRCLGPRSFARTAWAIVPAADAARRITVEAAPSMSTAVPDLALYVQPAGRRDVTTEPTTCAGRETVGDGSRGDEAAGATAVVGAGQAVLVQVGWRDGDAPEDVVTTLAQSTVRLAEAPRGLEPAAAPSIRLGRPSSVALRGATLVGGDPAQPRCLSQAAVWRTVRIRKAGRYALAVAGGATTVTAFRGRPTGDRALACASDADGPRVATTVRVRRKGVLWIRLGVDSPESTDPGAVLLRGPFRTERLARKALPSTASRAARIFRGRGR